jgi:hypothetical protein
MRVFSPCMGFCLIIFSFVGLHHRRTQYVRLIHTIFIFLLLFFTQYTIFLISTKLSERRRKIPNKTKKNYHSSPCRWPSPHGNQPPPPPRENKIKWNEKKNKYLKDEKYIFHFHNNNDMPGNNNQQGREKRKKKSFFFLFLLHRHISFLYKIIIIFFLP